MKNYSGFLLCSDFDGTLYYRNEISEENLAAIRDFQAGGGRFTLATGRYPTILEEPCAAKLKVNAPVIAMNGALLYDTKKRQILAEGTMSENFSDRLCSICENVSGIREVVFCPSESWKVIRLMPEQTDCFSAILQKKPYKIMFHIADPVQSDRITAEISEISGGDFCVSRSWASGIEVQGADYNKGSTARLLAETLGAHTLISVGDYENDILLLQASDIGFAVKNAAPTLSRVATHITRADASGAIAEIIRSL